MHLNDDMMDVLTDFNICFFKQRNSKLYVDLCHFTNNTAGEPGGAIYGKVRIWIC